MEIPTYNGACIYAIWNNDTNDFYIGSAKNLRTRIRGHLSKLNRNIHHSYKLQKAWNTYKNWEVVILKHSNEQQLLIDEQWCIDIQKPKYNICSIAGSTVGTKWTEEQRVKVVQYLKNKPKEAVENHKNGIRNSQLSKQASLENLKKATTANEQKLTIINLVTNEVIKFNSIKAVKSIGLTAYSIRNIVKGKSRKHKNKYTIKLE
jgi:group I intron endonuclease